jgi:hypothetical protein
VIRRLTVLAASLAVAAVPLAGCGDKAPGIPRGDAAEMIDLLQQAQEQSDDPQRCDELAATIRRVAARVRDLPAKTDQDVRDSLTNGVRNLAASARAQCRDTNTTTETTPTVPTTETVPPPTTETTPPPTTEVTPPPPTETTPPPTTPPTPTTPGTGGTGPGNGNGEGNGNGQGQGTGLGNGKRVPPGHQRGHGGRDKRGDG